MSDKFAVIESPCVSKRKQNTMAIINDHPENIYKDKKSLQEIYQITQFINSKRSSLGALYAIKFKLIKSDDNSLYEDECNRIISQNNSAPEFKNIKEFATWYKAKAKEIVQEILAEEEKNKYVSQMRNKH